MPWVRRLTSYLYNLSIDDVKLFLLFDLIKICFFFFGTESNLHETYEGNQSLSLTLWPFGEVPRLLNMTILLLGMNRIPSFSWSGLVSQTFWQYLVSTIYYFWESGFSISIQGIVFVIVVSMCTDDVPNVTQVVLSGLHPMPTRLFQQLTICKSQHWRWIARSPKANSRQVGHPT